MYIGDWYGADEEDINGGNLSDYFDIKSLISPIDLGKSIIKAGKEMWGKKKGNVPSLIAFYWLQHHYGCYPFETEIIFEKTSIINIE